ncbi:hypothetical protein TcYC6_0054100 [Trypanosoma cruzi]|uniref:Uncharacterized protein n=1 Tax=Trypanosoma cruzi (strain CL Brener) TaxID=353153 RepID=Q4DF12_TRYCC|nr:hypothetical protein Tc00.1047053509163.10 [Trypanosoma cruzi]EAN91108.1 hypothetical protein Tc00.1047053509163.10 [Trypanosoma cruzi]KAF8301718.1 hypothetical protein TcYC6_0054100 [Trypanosoma cruzi]|eukprot:XP_812959.1 hypothetical protein [Trypanosoma cruzi strain CL Brener]
MWRGVECTMALKLDVGEGKMGKIKRNLSFFVTRCGMTLHNGVPMHYNMKKWVDSCQHKWLIVFLDSEHVAVHRSGKPPVAFFPFGGIEQSKIHTKELLSEPHGVLVLVYAIYIILHEYMPCDRLYHKNQRKHGFVVGLKRLGFHCAYYLPATCVCVGRGVGGRCCVQEGVLPHKCTNALVLPFLQLHHV